MVRQPARGSLQRVAHCLAACQPTSESCAPLQRHSPHPLPRPSSLPSPRSRRVRRQLQHSRRRVWIRRQRLIDGAHRHRLTEHAACSMRERGPATRAVLLCRDPRCECGPLHERRRAQAAPRPLSARCFPSTVGLSPPQLSSQQRRVLRSRCPGQLTVLLPLCNPCLAPSTTPSAHACRPKSHVPLTPIHPLPPSSRASPIILNLPPALVSNTRPPLPAAALTHNSRAAAPPHPQQHTHQHQDTPKLMPAQPVLASSPSFRQHRAALGRAPPFGSVCPHPCLPLLPSSKLQHAGLVPLSNPHSAVKSRDSPASFLVQTPPFPEYLSRAPPHRGMLRVGVD